jgi:hypothetical protein
MSDDRKSQIDTMTLDELRAEVARLDALLTVPPPADPCGGLRPLQLEVPGGARGGGPRRRLVRCATSGPYADRWMAVVGDEIVCRDGNQLQFRPFEAIRPTLQERAAWPDIVSARMAAREG